MFVNISLQKRLTAFASEPRVLISVWPATKILRPGEQGMLSPLLGKAAWTVQGFIKDRNCWE